MLDENEQSYTNCGHFVSWIISVITVIVVCFSFFLKLPSPTKSLLHDTRIVEESFISDKTCIATIIKADQLKQGILFGHSLFHSGLQHPKMFAFVDTNIETSILDNYFHVKNIKPFKYKEQNYWSLGKHCQKVVAIDVQSLFNMPVNNICNSVPFSSVAKRDDISFFDSRFMILDPRRPIAHEFNSTINLNFQTCINHIFTNWTILPSSYFVEDSKKDFLSFWATFNSPTIIHYDSSILDAVINGRNLASSTSCFYKTVKRIIKSAIKDHPSLVDIS